MTKLTKEDVISQLEAALSKREDKTISIEQKGSWYKIDGGKSVRFAELETMLAEIGGDQANAQTTAQPQKAVASPPQKTAPSVTADTSTGKTPKQLWREKLAQGSGSTLPRGF